MEDPTEANHHYQVRREEEEEEGGVWIGGEDR